MTPDYPHKSHVVVRPAWSCTECARRKVKCNKEIPCAACLRRGTQHLCVREGEEGPEREQECIGSDHGGQDAVMETLKEIVDRMDRMERRMATMTERQIVGNQDKSTDGDQDRLSSGHENNLHMAASSSQHMPATAAESAITQNEDTSVTLEYLALGKNRRLGILGVSRHPHTRTASTINILDEDQARISAPSIVKQATLSDSTLQSVLQFHRDAVQWQHACIHTQTFTRQVESYVRLSHGLRWRRTDPLWLALLFSVQTIAIHQMPDPLFGTLFLDANRQQIVEQSLAASLRCLDVGQYMAKPQFSTCQTIAILSVCGHNVVDSNLLASLLAVGIKVAQMLNLHILGTEEESIQHEALAWKESGPSSSSSERWTQRLISYEMGTRVWWSLVQQDYFAIPFRGVSLVHFRQHDTPFPRNALDVDLDQGFLHAFEDDYPSLILKQRITSMSSDILFRFFDNLPRQRANWKENIAPFESSFLSLIPSSRSTLDSDQSVSYAQSLEQYLAISVRHKMLVMHRAFCERKPTSRHEILRSQAVCVELSREIIARCTSVTETLKVMWTTAYHVMAAATVLALDMFSHAASPTSPMRKKEVQHAHDVLQTMAYRSPIAARGVALLASLLEQYENAMQGQAVQQAPVPQQDVRTEQEFHKRPRIDSPIEQSEWQWEDWEQYEQIVSMLESVPDVSRLFDGTLGNRF